MFNDKVTRVNEILDEHGPSAIQVYDTGSFEAIGYKPQYIIDAVNEVFGIGKWRHVLHSHEVREVTTKAGNKRLIAIAEVSVQILGEPLFETGIQFGNGQIAAGNVGDGIKSAITDAIGKCFSLMSIGFKAYRGELDKPKNASVVKMEAVDTEIASDLGIGKPEVVITPAATSVVTSAPTGFRARTSPAPTSAAPAPSNGNGKTEEKPQLSTTAAPTARFRSSGLTAAK